MSLIEESRSDAPEAPVTPDGLSEDERLLIDQQSEIERLKALLQEATASRVSPVPEYPFEYEWPEPTPEQKKKLKPGGDAPVRVIKHTYGDPDARFMALGDRRIVNIGQYRIPMANQKFDSDRLFLEFRRLNLVTLEEVFRDAKGYCELNECWTETPKLREDEHGKPVFDSFCSIGHRNLALHGHNRMWVFE